MTKQRSEAIHAPEAAARARVHRRSPEQLSVLKFYQQAGNRGMGRLLASYGIQAKLTVADSGDRHEAEADRAADHVLNKPPGATPAASGLSRVSLAPLQRKASRGAGAVGPSLEGAIHAARGGGHPIPSAVRSHLEPRFGADFSRVRLHTDTAAAGMASAAGAHAFTTGRNIFFASGRYQPDSPGGRRLLAHELAHTIQQGDRSGIMQRYEAGEHAKMGETQAELQHAFRPAEYVVKKGETLEAIAKRFSITVDELKEANKDKLKTWPAADKSGGKVVGFNEGEKISIPQKLNDLAKGMIKDKSAKVVVNGVVLEYGVVIAMGDLYGSPEDVGKAPPAELQAISALVKREQATGTVVTTADWQTATGGRFLKLAEKNTAHFAPPDPSLVTASSAGASGPNHKSEWEKHHSTALDTSKAGDKDKALMTNAFADHFLTDAFSAGHLLNKSDLMEQFKSHLKLDAKGEEFDAPSKKFFDAIAATAFVGGVATEFAKYETFDAYAAGWHPNIDRADRFSTLLQKIHKEEPDLLGSAVAKGVHDKLNTLPGGLPVENERGDKWNLSGDTTLNPKTLEIARGAVAQSQLNVISVFKSAAAIAYSALFKKVWEFTPKPSATGKPQVKDAADKGTDTNSSDLRTAIVGLINANYLVIIAELVKRKKLRKA